MSLTLTGFWVDIILISLFVVMMILGIHTGFMKKVYDLISFMAVLFLSLYFCRPLASFLMFLTLKEASLAFSLVVKLSTSMIYQAIAFFILWLIGMILRFLLGKMIKPMLETFVESFSLLYGLDRLLAVISYGFIALFISSGLLFVLRLPAFHAHEAIQDSLLAPYVLKYTPSYLEQGIELLDQIDMLQNIGTQSQMDEASFKTFIQLISTASKAGMISNEDVENFILEYEENLALNANIEMSRYDYEQLMNLLEESQLSEQTKQKIYQMMTVKEG